MPATSDRQQHFFALLHSIKMGKLKGKVTGKAKKAANSMSDSTIKEFMHKKAFLDGYRGA